MPRKDDKKYYWIKLKTDFFEEENIDYLLSQKNGCEYIVLYQMLCLKTANNYGKMASEVGEMIIPFSPEKISRDTKYFEIDTVIIALELYKKLGLIYEDKDGILEISNLGTMVGQVKDSTIKKREYRARKRLEENSKNVDLIEQNSSRTMGGQWEDNVRQEIEIDIELDIEKDKDIKDKEKEPKETLSNSPKKQTNKSKIKHKYGEYKNVRLTDDEYSRLKNDFSFYEEMIKLLDEAIEIHGYKYKSHSMVLRKWVLDEVKKKYDQKPINEKRELSTPIEKTDDNLDELLEELAEGKL